MLIASIGVQDSLNQGLAESGLVLLIDGRHGLPEKGAIRSSHLHALGLKFLQGLGLVLPDVLLLEPPGLLGGLQEGLLVCRRQALEGLEIHEEEGGRVEVSRKSQILLEVIEAVAVDDIDGVFLAVDGSLLEGGQSLSPRFSGNGLIRLPLENCCFAQHCPQVVGERALLA